MPAIRGGTPSTAPRPASSPASDSASVLIVSPAKGLGGANGGMGAPGGVGAAGDAGDAGLIGGVGVIPPALCGRVRRPPGVRGLPRGGEVGVQRGEFGAAGAGGG